MAARGGQGGVQRGRDAELDQRSVYDRGGERAGPEEQRMTERSHPEMKGQNEDLSWGCWGQMDHLRKAMVVFACTGLVTSRTVQTTHGELSQPQVPDSGRPPGSRLSGPRRPREVNVQWGPAPTPTHTLCSKQGLGRLHVPHLLEGRPSRASSKARWTRRVSSQFRWMEHW